MDEARKLSNMTAAVVKNLTTETDTQMEILTAHNVTSMQMKTLEHFLLHCESYEHIRQRLPFLSNNTITNQERLAIFSLLSNENDIDIKKDCFITDVEKRDLNN